MENIEPKSKADSVCIKKQEINWNDVKTNLYMVQ